MRVLKSGKILIPLLFGTVFLLFGAEAYHYDWDWHVLMFRNRVRMAGLPIRVLCEGEVLLKTRTAKDAKPFECLARQAVAEYKAEGDQYTNNLQTYTSTGDFLNYGLTKGSFPNPDTNGIPRVSYGGKLQYNPVTIAHFALTMYGRYVRGDQAAYDKFLRGARQLTNMQDSRGALRYQFAWKYYLSGETYPPGWASALAQGLALSVFARAYHLTGDGIYLDAGDRSFDFLVTPISEGGVMDNLGDVEPSLAANIMFEEYVATPSGHTLNGFMCTLLGLYDWSQFSVSRAREAQNYFNRGVKTLKQILGYYDIGGFTTYDLGFITYHKRPFVEPFYHSVHIFVLHALTSITNDNGLSKYEKLWSSYVPR